MNKKDYFEVIELQADYFHFKFTGFFSDEAIEAVGPEIKEEYQNAIDSFGGKPFINMVDLRGLKALPEKAKAFVAGLMTYGKERGLYYSININPSAISKMSIRGVGSDSNTSELRIIVGTEEDAEKILKEKLKELAG